MKKLLFNLVIFVGLVANTAAQTFVVNGVNYNVVSAINPYTVEVVAKNPIYTGAVTIPATVANSGTTYSVIRIAQQAFQNCTGLTSVTMPNSVTDIGLSAFAGCTGLTNVVFPNALIYIKSYAFIGCSSLTQINLPTTLQLINIYAFSGCASLTSVTIPASVATIGTSAFAGCTKLTSFTVNGTNATYKSVNGAILTKNGATLVQCPAGVSTFEVPAGVTTVGANSLSECSKLEMVFLPTSLTTIAESAFSNCAVLDTIYCNATTPPTVANANAFTSVPANATIFVPSTSVSTYTVPTHWMGFANIVQIPTSSTFFYNGIKYLKIAAAPTTVEVVANTTNYSGDIIIPEQFSFNYQPFTVKSIGNRAFADCNKLKSITMPNTITEIKDYAFFQSSGMVTAQLSNSLQKIGIGAFMRCYALKTITLPASLKEIDEYGFNNCNELSALIIPKNTTKIGAAAFSSINSLSTVALETGNTAYKQVNGAIFTINGDTLMYVPTLVTGYTIPATVKFINTAAFAGCSKLTSITIPNTVQKIGEYLFEDCSALTEFTLPSTFTKIPQGMFLYCKGLTTVHLPDNLTKIGPVAFYYSTSLKTITIPSGVTVIDHQGFYSAGLTSLYIKAVNPPTLESTTFQDVTKTIPVYVPAGSVAAYTAADYWKEFTNINALPTSVTETYSSDNIVPILTLSVLKIDNLEHGSEVELYNVNGALLMKQTVDNSVFEYNTQALSSGMYIVRINQNGIVKSHKIVKK